LFCFGVFVCVEFLPVNKSAWFESPIVGHRFPRVITGRCIVWYDEVTNGLSADVAFDMEIPPDGRELAENVFVVANED
jgi:hypothetical protein